MPYGHNWTYDLRRFGGRSIGPIFDVGANIGQTAWALVRYFPSDPIYCFEPVAGAFDTLQRVYGHRVHCIRKALGSAPGTAQIKLHSNSELNTLARPGPLASTCGLDQTETIEVDTVDDFARSAGVDRIGLLKMDVQGWELEVLKGARRFLDEKRVRFVFAEVGFHADNTDMQGFAELNDYLSGRGFVFSGLYDQFRWGDKRQVHFANALYSLAG